MSDHGTGGGPIPAEGGSGPRAAEIKSMVQRELCRMAPALRGYKVYLFGSRAGGNARERPDFDVGVLGEQPLPLKTFYEIEDILEDLPARYRIDWVDLKRMRNRMRNLPFRFRPGR